MHIQRYAMVIFLFAFVSIFKTFYYFFSSFFGENENFV